ncbi:hypothetical protein CVT26_001284 [Gymnopilus dilepis]|uniref:Uncharacterized protein n=1 Tax=Gymnopilus dilepis TaxID=231916 RepID=A0A409WBG7_9AGAR|nr:hypothetical protein CVT26_001284 [Gymnopilus dilepis]
MDDWIRVNVPVARSHCLVGFVDQFGNPARRPSVIGPQESNLVPDLVRRGYGARRGVQNQMRRVALVADANILRRAKSGSSPPFISIFLPCRTSTLRLTATRNRRYGYDGDSIVELFSLGHEALENVGTRTTAATQRLLGDKMGFTEGQLARVTMTLAFFSGGLGGS